MPDNVVEIVVKINDKVTAQSGKVNDAIANIAKTSEAASSVTQKASADVAKSNAEVFADLKKELFGASKPLGDFSKAADDAAKSAGESGDAAEGMAKKFSGLAVIGTIAITVAAAAAAFAGLIKAGFSSADALGDAAERASVSVESLSKLKFAAEQSDVSFDALTLGIKKWQVTLSQAADVGSEAANALGLLKLKASDLSGLKLEDQLAKIADQFKRIQDPADRTRVAVELFGRSGEDLVPLLGQGGDAIKELTNRADELGVTLDGTTTKAVDRADKALKQLKATVDSFFQRTAGSIARAIIGPVDEFDDVETKIDALVKRRDEILKGSVRLPGPERDNQLKDIDAQIAGQRELLAVLQRMKGFEDQRAKDNALVIPSAENEKLLQQLKSIQVSLSLLPDPLVEFEKQTQTTVEKVTREFEIMEVHLDALVKAGKITVDEANKRSNDKLDEILKPVQISVDRLKVPLSAAQVKAKEFTDTLKEGLENAARSGETSARSILRNLLAAFESKALQRAIDGIGAALERALNKGSGKGGLLGALSGIVTGVLGGGGSDGLEPVTPTVHKIPVHAAGGGSMSGMRVVGEEGPELEAGGGGQVFNRRQLQFMGGGGITINQGDINIGPIQGSGDPQQLAALMETRIQQGLRRNNEGLLQQLKNNGFGDIR